VCECVCAHASVLLCDCVCCVLLWARARGFVLVIDSFCFLWGVGGVGVTIALIGGHPLTRSRTGSRMWHDIAEISMISHVA